MHLCVENTSLRFYHSGKGASKLSSLIHSSAFSLITDVYITETQLLPNPPLPYL